MLHRLATSMGLERSQGPGRSERPGGARAPLAPARPVVTAARWEMSFISGMAQGLMGPGARSPLMDDRGGGSDSGELPDRGPAAVWARARLAGLRVPVVDDFADRLSFLQRAVCC